jgi:hypothetical protein
MLKDLPETTTRNGPSSCSCEDVSGVKFALSMSKRSTCHAANTNRPLNVNREADDRQHKESQS